MVLQNVLDMHHPLTKGSALAVSVSQAASRKRARELIAARRLAAGGASQGVVRVRQRRAMRDFMP
jgi:hypothetical protein